MQRSSAQAESRKANRTRMTHLSAMRSSFFREAFQREPKLFASNLRNASLSLLRNVPEGRCDRSLARSAWGSATPKEPSRRVRCDSRRDAHRFDKWSDEISNAKTCPAKSVNSG